MKTRIATLAVIALAGLLAGCSNQSVDTGSGGPSAEGAKFLLTAQPEGATDVIQVRESAADGDDVTIVGRIGGSENPWIDGRAAFSIVDSSLKACSDIPGDTCEMPWDYCCETPKLPTSTALIKFVDQGGVLLKEDARELLGVKELSTVIVQGKAQRDDAGNLTVLATGLYIKQK
jgi:hypothetical protein